MSRGDKYDRQNDKGEPETVHVKVGQKVSFVHPNTSSVEATTVTGRYVRRNRQSSKHLSVDDGQQLWRVHPNNIRKVED